MANFTAISFIDVSQMTANLLLRYRDSWDTHRFRQEHEGSPHHATKTIILRGPANPSPENWQEDVEHVDYPILDKFKSAVSVLSKIKHAVSPINEGRPGKIGKAMIVSLQPGGFVDWHCDEGEYAEAHNRFHLCLVPAAGAALFSGPEIACPVPGNLMWINNRVLHSAINMGTNARIHLIVDVQKP